MTLSLIHQEVRKPEKCKSVLLCDHHKHVHVNVITNQAPPQKTEKRTFYVSIGFPAELWVFGTHQVMQIEAIPLRLANSYRIFYAHWLHMTFDANVTVDALHEMVEHKQVSKDTIKHTDSSWNTTTLGQINHCNSSLHVHWCQSLFPALILNFGHNALLRTFA